MQFIHLDLERRNRDLEYIANTRRLFANHVTPRVGRRDVKSITKRGVTDLLDAIMDEGKPTTANRVFASLRAMCRWAACRGIIDVPPTGLTWVMGRSLVARSSCPTRQAICCVDSVRVSKSEPMIGDELADCLLRIGWSAAELGRRVRIHDRRLRRMMHGTEAIPDNLAEWVRLYAETVAAAIARGVADLVRVRG